MYKNEELYIDCDNIKIHAKIDFPGKQTKKMHLLVIIPGLTGHIEERHIIAVKDSAVKCGYTVLRAELYGHGKSGGDFYDHTILMHLHEAMRVIDFALELPYCKDVIVAGHSQGGLTAILASGLMFDKVKAAIPMSPAINIWDGARNGSFLGIEFDKEHIPDYVTKYGDRKLSGNYIRAAAILPVEEAVAKFKKPVLVTHGTADEAVPYCWAEWLNERYNNMRLVRIEGDDHCYDYHLDEVLCAVEDFLTEMK